MVLAISTKSGSELRLSEEADLPMKFSRHFAVRVHTGKLGNLRVHLARVLDHLLHGQLDFADDVIGGVTIRVPKLDTQVFIGLDELGGDEKTADMSINNSQLSEGITYAAVSSQIGFKSSVMTRVQYIGFPYLEKERVMYGSLPPYLLPRLSCLLRPTAR